MQLLCEALCDLCETLCNPLILLEGYIEFHKDHTELHREYITKDRASKNKKLTPFLQRFQH